MRFYGRKEELSTLRSHLNTVREKRISQLVVVLGRRRVGKTTLVLKAFEGETIPVFYFFAERHATEAELVSLWLTDICKAYGVQFPPAISGASELLNYLMTLTKEKECVCIIDECQNLGGNNPRIWSQIQRVWDLKKSSSRLLLLMTGSVMTLMEDIFLRTSKPLYGRASSLIVVRPFAPKTVREIVLTENPKAKPLDLLAIYALTGGVAQYLTLLAEAESLTLDGMLDYIFSVRGTWLRYEGEIYLSNEFRAEAPSYIEILRAVATGATKWNEIESRVQSASQLAPYLNRLERFRIIRRVQPIFEDQGRRRLSRYAIRDQYFLFWLTFILPAESRRLAEFGNWKQLKEETKQSLPTFLGKTLERWFLESYLAEGSWENVGSWWDKKGQNEIDLVGVNSKEKILEIAEVKLNSEKYSAALLEAKANAFLLENPKLKDYTLKLKGLSLENM